MPSERARRTSMTRNEAMKTHRISGVPQLGEIALPFWDLINSPLVVKTYLASGGNPNTRPKESSTFTMLHWACHFGQTEVVEMLLRAGADAHAKDYLGREPLDIAAELNYYADMVDLFLAFEKQKAIREEGSLASSGTQ